LSFLVTIFTVLCFYDRVRPALVGPFDVFPRKEVPFWGSLDTPPQLVAKLPKLPFYRVFKQNSQDVVTCVLSKLLHRCQPYFVHPQRLPNTISGSVGGPNMRKTDPRWRTATVAKKIAISRQRFNRSSRDLVHDAY